MNCPAYLSLLTIPALSGSDVLFETSFRVMGVDLSAEAAKIAETEYGVHVVARHVVYFLMVIAAHPFAMLESACGHGATLTIEARKK